MRQLSPEEAALWARVTATIKPLSRVIQNSRNSIQTTEQEQISEITLETKAALAVPPAKVARPAPPRPGTTLDGSWDKKVRSGALEPDRILDLHGHSLDRAWQAIDRSLEQSIAAGDRVVLLITGHERAGEPPVERGRIRAAVHDWLAVSRHAANIAAVRGAHRRHGGGGSLYIVLRRKREHGSTLY